MRNSVKCFSEVASIDRTSLIQNLSPFVQHRQKMSGARSSVNKSMLIIRHMLHCQSCDLAELSGRFSSLSCSRQTSGWLAYIAIDARSRPFFEDRWDPLASFNDCGNWPSSNDCLNGKVSGSANSSAQSFSTIDVFGIRHSIWSQRLSWLQLLK